MEKPPSNFSRYLQVAAFVTVWMALGLFLQLGNPAYQAIGVVMMIGFQRWIARRPFAQLWVRSAAGFRFDRGTAGWVVLLMGAAGITLFLRKATSAGVSKQGALLLFLVAAAVPAGFALRHTNLAGLIRALPSVIVGKVLGWGWRLVVVWIGGLMGFGAGRSPHVAFAQWPDLAGEFLLQFLAAFLIEEVVFRGGLDTYVSRTETTRWGELRSAAFVSLFWALYHLPIQGAHAVTPAQQVGLALHVTGIAIAGVPLAYVWRRSGTLVLPAALHAFGNAYVLTAMK